MCVMIYRPILRSSIRRLWRACPRTFASLAMTNETGQAQQWSVSRLKNEKNYANEPLLDAAVRKLNSVQAALDDTHRSYKAEITVIQTALARAEEERRCTCLHDYYEGDHHYRFCPASSESGQGRLRAQLKAATERAEVAEAADLVWVSDYGGNVSLNLRIEELEAKRSEEHTS